MRIDYTHNIKNFAESYCNDCGCHPCRCNEDEKLIVEVDYGYEDISASTYDTKLFIVLLALTLTGLVALYKHFS